MVYLKSLIGAALLSAASAEFGDPIVGGVVASTSDYEWMVSLQSSGRHFCGGSLIAPNVVLTAAHCMGGSFSVAVKGSNTGRASGARSYSVKKVYSHENYSSSSSRNDIAIVELSESVDASIATPVPYDQTASSTTAHAGDAVTVIGWGRLSEGGSTPTNLMEVTVQGFTNAQCAQGYPNQIYPDMFCAGVSGGGKDSCQGDSGGPIYKVVGGQQVQVGVVSWGYGCARAGQLGVYARVAYQKDWIQGKLDLINGGGGGGTCQDDPLGWYDSDGPTYDCEWYAQGSNCARYGNGYANQGKTANQACCACGGGTTVTSVAPATSRSICGCDQGSGPYDKCVAVESIGSTACLIDFRGGFDNPPKCVAEAGAELKFSKNYNRWYIQGCVPLPRLVTEDATEANNLPLVGGEAPVDVESPVESDNTILIVGASVGIIGAALVVGMIVVVKSRKSNDEFDNFKVTNSA